jgi:hypothetical protein
MVLRELYAKLSLIFDSSGFKKAEAAVDGLKGAMLKIGAGAIAAGVGLKHLVGEAAENAERVGNVARMTGIATDKLQELEYAAKRSNVSAEELQVGLVHMARSAQEAAHGGAQAALAYQKVGVQFADVATGKLRPLADVVGDLADRFSKMPDGTEKTALAMELFGRSGARLIPVLDEGRDGLAKMGVEARNLGVVMDTRALAAGQRYQASAERMSAAITGLRNAIAVRLFGAMAKSTEQWIKLIAVNRQWIALRVQQAFEFASSALAAFVKVGNGVVDLFERIWQAGSTAKVLLIALGVIAAAVLAPWTSLLTVIALIAEDVSKYFEGKGSLTGRIVYAFKRLRLELMSSGFGQVIVEAFDAALDSAKRFFDFLDGKVQKTDEAFAQSKANARAWIGAIAGGLVGGPLGALLGGMIGYGSAGGALAGKPLPAAGLIPGGRFRRHCEPAVFTDPIGVPRTSAGCRNHSTECSRAAPEPLFARRAWCGLVAVRREHQRDDICA